MHPVTRKPSLRLTLVATLIGTILVAGCAPVPGSEEFCLALLAETIAVGEQLADLEGNPEDVDVNTACQYLGNFLRLVDEGCIDEADFEGSVLPEGTTRGTLVELYEAFDCP